MDKANGGSENLKDENPVVDDLKIEKEREIKSKDSISDQVDYRVKFKDANGKKVREDFVGQAILNTIIVANGKDYVLDKGENIIEVLVDKNIDIGERSIFIDHMLSNIIIRRDNLDYINILKYKIPYISNIEEKTIHKDEDRIEKNGISYKELDEKNISNNMFDLYYEKKIRMLDDLNIKLLRASKDYKLPEEIQVVDKNNKIYNQKVKWEELDTDKIDKIEVKGILVDKNGREIKEAYTSPTINIDIVGRVEGILNKILDKDGKENKSGGKKYTYTKAHLVRDDEIYNSLFNEETKDKSAEYIEKIKKR